MIEATRLSHGGMPVEVTKLTQPDTSILYYDPRQHPIDDEDPHTLVGYNGHVELVFNGRDLTIEYHDILNSNMLLTETFTPTGSGALRHSFSTPRAVGCSLDSKRVERSVNRSPGLA